MAVRVLARCDLAVFRRYASRCAALGAGLLAVSCSSASTPAATSDAIDIMLDSSLAQAAQGGTVVITGSATRSGGFTGAVSITVSGLPAGVTDSVAYLVTSDSISTFGVTIFVAGSVTPGAYTLTVRASGQGVTTATAAFTLTVPATPTYTISVDPAAVDIAQGGSNTATVVVFRGGGFTGAVNLTVSGGAGVFAGTISPDTISGGTSTITLIAPQTQPLGMQMVTIHASATGFASDQTTPLTVNVTPAGGDVPNVAVDFTACTTALQPIWFAYQNGSAWTVIPAAGHLYQFAVLQPTGGYAWVVQSPGGGTQIDVAYLTPPGVGFPVAVAACTPAGTKSMSGTLAGMVAGQQATVSLDNAIAVSTFPTASYALAGLADGTADLMAYRTAAGGPPSSSDRMIIRRGLPIVDGGVIPVLDFGGGESVTPSQATITVTGAGGGVISATMSYYLSNCASAGALYSILNPPATIPVYGVPGASQLQGDMHALSIGVTTGDTTVLVQDFFHTLVDHVVTVPAPLPAPTITILGGGYKRLQATDVLPFPVAYKSMGTFSYADGLSAHSVSISATGYPPAPLMAMPAFSGLPGFQDGWAPAASAAVTWTLGATSNNLTGADRCVEGAHFVTLQVTGSQ
ncbi:MAG: hypothetical protein ACREL5_04355 [Gemmatimonadales bacterium]